MSESVEFNSSDLASLKKRIADLESEASQLQTENTHLRRLYDRAPLSYQSLDENGYFIDVNQAWLEILGYTRDEVIGRNFSEFLDPEWSNHFRVNFPKFKTIGEILGVEFKMVRKDGSTIFVSFHGKIGKDPQGKFLQTHCIFEDITDRIEYENRLKESETKFKSLFENAADAIYMVTMDEKIVDVNSVALKQTGYSKAEMLNMKFRDLSPDDNSKRNSVLIWENIPLGDIATLSTHYTRKDGSQFPVEISLTRFKLEEEIILLAFVRDVTEKLKFENQLRQSQKLESIGNLAGGIAHDFNNILSSVIGYTELALEDAQQNTMQQDNLNEVLAASSRAKELVRQILAFAHKSDEMAKPVELGAVVTDSLKLLRSSIPTTIEIVQSIDATSLIMARLTQIHQVLMNLCTNAAQAMEDAGGVLEVTMKNITLGNFQQTSGSGLSAGEYVELTVADTGTGIDAAIIDNIFDPYFTTKGVGKGTGLGLAMVKGIIESHGGQIQVTSKPNYRTAFVVHLPLTTNEELVVSVPENILMKGSEHILYIDDEPTIVEMGSRLLSRLGYTVTSQTSSTEALELFRGKADTFDLVITDMTMPQMTGDKLSMELRKIRADIPIILCTGYSSKINEDNAKAQGINAYLNKPFTKADIAETLRTVLDGKSALRKLNT